MQRVQLSKCNSRELPDTAGECVSLPFHMMEGPLLFSRKLWVPVQTVGTICHSSPRKELLIFPIANYSWPVQLPTNLPSCGKCTFAWTWVNAIGNREYYMNCADVKIVGGPGRSIQGRPLFLANLPGFAQYTPPAHDGGPAASSVTFYPIVVQ